MTPTAELAKLVLEQNKETQAQQERLVALVALHHDELDQLSRVLPDLKREALDNINARLADVVADAMGKTSALVDEKTAHFDAAAEQEIQRMTAMLHALQATRDEINALLAQLDQRQVKSLDALARALSGIAEKKAREMLASDENKETIRAAFIEHSKPILAALESKGGSFIDLYQGEFIAGKSSAKRGQIWTYFGNTLLCTKDTDQAPQYYDTSESWALLAAKGAGGAAGTGGGGGDGTGDVVGPASATDGAPALFDTTTGKLLKNSTPTGTGNPVLQTSPTLTTPNIGTPSAGVLTNCTDLPLAGMADLAQDQFIGRTTASTGTPETATITAAARTVLDDANVAAMVNTLGGATSTGTGGLVRAASPSFSGTVTVTGTGGAVLNNDSASAGAISSTGGGQFDITAPIQLSGAVKDSAASAGAAGQVLKSNGSGVLSYANNLGCYALQFCAGAITTVNDANTYYLGFCPTTSLTTVPGRFRLYVPKSGTVKACELMSYASTAGSDEAWTWALLVNNTTSANVQTVNTSATLRRWTNTAMSTDVVAGDYLEFVTTTPNWATNPATLSMMGTAYIETVLT